MIEIAARYFGYEPKVVFLSDKPEKGCIYLGEQKVFTSIFPLRTAKRVSHTPELHVVLRRNMTSMDLVNNEQALREEGVKEVKQAEDEMALKEKMDREREEAEAARIAHEKVMQKYRKKLEMRRFLKGFVNFIMAISLFMLMIRRCDSITKNVDSI